MKKIIAFIIGLACFCSCMSEAEYQEYMEHEAERKSQYVQDRCFIVELEFEGGHKHEYIKYSSGDAAGLTHYPDCKYCKQRGIYYNY